MSMSVSLRSDSSEARELNLRDSSYPVTEFFYPTVSILSVNNMSF